MELNVLSCELETARKIFWLLAHDHIFLGTYNEEKVDWDDGAYPVINCNDVFVPAADAESLKADELDMYIEACKRWPSDASIAWVAVKRNAKPWRLTPGPEFDEAKRGIEAMLSNVLHNRQTAAGRGLWHSPQTNHAEDCPR